MLVAALWMFHSGFAIDAQPDRESLIAAIWQHIGVSMILLPICSLVLVVRLLKLKQSPIKQLRDTVEKLLIWLLLAMFVSGFLTVWARGSAIKVFDWFAIPSPVDRMQTLYAILEYSHGALSYLCLLSAAIWLFMYVLSKLRISKAAP